VKNREYLIERKMVYNGIIGIEKGSPDEVRKIYFDFSAVENSGTITLEDSMDKKIENCAKI